MNCVRQCAGLITLLCSLGATQGAMTVTTNYYQVSGTSLYELRESINQCRPREFLVPMDAQTKSRIDWSYTFRHSRTGSRLRSLEVQSKVAFTFPMWVNASNAPVEVVEKWEKYLAALKVHEAGHLKLALVAEAQLEKEVKALGEMPTDQALEDAINKTAYRVLADFRRKEVEYDKLTGHGITQGARFPW